MGITKKVNERRSDSREHYSGYIFFSTKDDFFEAELRNYSTHGLFIKTDENLTLGEFITVALPYVEDKLIKFQGQILWRNNEGYGIELIRNRNNTDLQHLKIVAKSR